MSIIKFVSPSGWDFQQRILTPIKVSSRGLIGADRTEFLKTASHSFADQLDQLKFAKDEVPVHLIALGASEAYGPNRNGDGFKEAACRKYHDTFVKFAKFYRNHKNKAERGDPYYGIVKASAYNEDMRRVELLCSLNAEKSAVDRNGGFIADAELEKLANGGDYPVSMACVTDPEYPVLVKDKGYVAIKDVTVGDNVWTHKGRWRPVTQLNRRKFTGEVYTFEMNANPFPLELTSDHPMFAKVFEGSKELATVKGKARRYFRDTSSFESEPADWVHAEHVGVGDRFFCRPVTAFPGYGAIACQDLAALMGYYLAEGSLQYNGERACSVVFTVNYSDSAVRRIPQIMSRLHPDITVSLVPKHNSEHSLSIIINDTEFAEFIRSQVKAGVRRKIIPPEIFNASDGVKLAFLGTWLDGDGWLDKKGGHWSTCNQNLALQGRDLLLTLGIPSSTYRIDHAKCETSGYDGSSIEYTLNVSHLDAWRLAEHSAKAADYVPPSQSRTKPASLRYCPDGSYALRIKKVTSRSVEDQLTYNFEVAEDESYSLGGLISHNCRVPNDVCSFCKHAARNRDEYCTGSDCAAGGCKKNLTRLVKVAGDLHHLHVDNPHPTWFDISRVFRPADRIAFGAKADYLTKSASDSDWFDLQDYIKMAESSTAPLDVVLYQSGNHGIWSEKYASQVRLGYALASMEGERVSLNEYRPLSTRRFPVEKMASFGSAKCDTQLSALADRQIILNFNDYARLADKEEHVKSASAILPGIYTRMINDESLPIRVESGACEFIDKTANEDSRMLAAVTFADHSLQKSATEDRGFLSCIRGQSAPEFILFEKSASCDEGANELASDYAMYKLAALWRSAAADADFPLTVRLSLRQNQVV